MSVELVPAKDRAWREVVHIERRVGDHGGEYWSLRLECSHLAFRPVRRLRIGEMLPAPMRVQMRNGKFWRPKTTIPTAPKRVRCMWCRAVKCVRKQR